MVAGQRRGAIINLASQAIRGAARGVHYAASTGGVVAMTRAMALELAPHGIRVNAIAPGLTDTAQPRYGSSEEELAVMASAVPLGRMAQPDDIAAVAVFLASDDARHVTGQRSEEHTSELQSLTNLVCRLLLEKKKQKKTQT